MCLCVGTVPWKVCLSDKIGILTESCKKELKAPWVPEIKDDKDTSHFYEFDEEEEKYTPYRRLRDEEQTVFEDFEFIEVEG